LDIGESDQIGEITFALSAANEDSETATITLSGSGNVYADKIVTAEGLKIQLPWEHTVSNYTDNLGGDGAFHTNRSADDFTATMGGTAWTMNFTEETEGGNINAGSSFTVTLGFNDGETSVTTIGESVFSGGQDFETTDGSDDYIGYVSSDLATMTMYATGGDQDSIDITYHGTEAFGEVFISESGATVGGDNGPIGPAMTDTEVTSSLNKNLIVVGGSCVNTVAAQLLGSSTPLCGPDFTAATGVGSGSFLIQTFERANKVATLVAGYNAGDTTNAAQALTTQTIDTTAGMKYTGTTATSVEPVVA
jgi:hypothetical protein